MAYTVFEAGLIAAIVAFSMVQLLRTLLPKTARAVAGRMAAALRQEASPALRHLGVWLTPKDVADSGCGLGGCSSCKACSTFTFDPAAEPVPPRTAR